MSINDAERSGSSLEATNLEIIDKVYMAIADKIVKLIQECSCVRLPVLWAFLRNKYEIFCIEIQA